MSTQNKNLSDAVEHLGDKKWLRKNLTPSLLVKIILVLTIIVALLGYIIWDLVARGPVSTFLSNRDQIVEAVRDFGLLGPLLFIAISIVQTVVAPIPGQVIGSVGGYIFGWWGILWMLIGNTIGCFIVFKLAKVFGRPLLERIFKPEMIDKFDFLLGNRNAGILMFLIFLLPGFPDDLICYIAGLTPLSIKQLMILVTLGHLPGIVLTNYMGAGLTENTWLVAGIAVISVVILGIFVYRREKIIKFFKQYKKD